MKKPFLLARQFSTKKTFINPAPFSFLPKCSKSRFDMTSAEPLNPCDNGITPPKKIFGLMQNMDFRDFKESRHDLSQGEDFALDACGNFFGRHGIKCERNNISFSSSILEGLEKAFQVLELNKDRKVLVSTPTFGYYFKMLSDKNIGFETIRARKEDGFLPNSVELEDAIIKSGAVALLLCNPNNPTSAIMTEEGARSISDISKRLGTFVISDEAFFMSSSISGKKHFPIASIDGMLERSLTFTSVSKSICTGNKLAFCIGQPRIVEQFARLGGYPSKRDQRIIAAAVEDSEENREYHEKCRQYYLDNISLVKNKISELNQKFCEEFGEAREYVKPYISDPDTANVYLLDFSGLRGKTYNGKAMNSGLDAATWLLDSASIGSVPGECSLFDEKEMLVRITLNHSPHEIGLAFDSAITAASAIQNPLVAQTSNAAAGEEIIPSNSLKTSKKSVSKVVESELKGISSDKF